MLHSFLRLGALEVLVSMSGASGLPSVGADDDFVVFDIFSWDLIL